MSRSSPLVSNAIRVAAAGLGAAVAGPLGGAIGAVVGNVFGASAAELIKTYTEKFGEEAGKKLCDTGADSLLEKLKPTAPDLEFAYREALRRSLSMIRAQISAQGESDYEDWFANWDVCLKTAVSLRLEEIQPAQLASESLESLFRNTMERLDGQGGAIRRRNPSILLETRSLPETLLDELTTHLPDHFKENFDALIVQPNYEQAWKQAELAFRDSLAVTLGRIDERTAQVAEDTAAMRQQLSSRQTFDEKFLERYDDAVKRGLIAELKVQELEAERVRQADELRKLQQQLAARSAEPAEAELSRLLDAGDLDSALRLKSQKVKKRRQESAKLPLDLYELGTIHELRFEWPQALDAYREAWELGKKLDHGFKYAHFAQKLNRFSDAITAYETLLSLYTTPADRAATLNNLAVLYRATQRMQKAEEAYGGALAIYRKLADDNPDAYLHDVAMTLNNLAALYRDTQRMQKAEEAYGEALAIRRKLAEANPDAYLPDVAMTLNNLAILYRATQRMQKVEEAYVEALAAHRKLAEANPDAYLPDVAVTLNNLAFAYLSTQRIKEAEEHCNEAEVIFLPLWQRTPELHGDQWARILGTYALVAEASENSASTACTLARRAFAAAYNPDLKKEIETLIDRLCHESVP